MKYIAIFGLVGGAAIALGRLPLPQLRAAAGGLLALLLAYGLTVLPWLLTLLFAWLWWKQRRRTWLYERIAISEQGERQRLGAKVWRLERAAERGPRARKRAT